MASAWLADISVETRKAAGLETNRWRVPVDNFSNGAANRLLPSIRYVERTGKWIAIDGSPYRIPVMSDERRQHLERMKAENEARLKELMKPPCLDRLPLTGQLNK